MESFTLTFASSSDEEATETDDNSIVEMSSDVKN